jgi:hypothetical protein
MQWLTEGGWGFNPFPHPPKFPSFDKADPNSQFHGKYRVFQKELYNFESL